MRKFLLLLALIPSLAFADIGAVIRSATPTIDTNIYASGDALGGKLTFTAAGRANVHSGKIQSVMITDLAKQSANVDLLIFDSDPSATTFTNNAALDIADADLLKLVCVIPVTTHATFNDNSVSSARANECVFNTSDSILYGALVVRATPTFAGTSDVTVRLAIRQD